MNSGWKGENSRHSIVGHGAMTTKSLQAPFYGTFTTTEIYITPMKPNSVFKQKGIEVLKEAHPDTQKQFNRQNIILKRITFKIGKKKYTFPALYDKKNDMYYIVFDNKKELENLWKTLKDDIVKTYSEMNDFIYHATLDEITGFRTNKEIVNEIMSKIDKNYDPSDFDTLTNRDKSILLQILAFRDDKISPNTTKMLSKVIRNTPPAKLEEAIKKALDENKVPKEEKENIMKLIDLLKEQRFERYVLTEIKPKIRQYMLKYLKAKRVGKVKVKLYESDVNALQVFYTNNEIKKILQKNNLPSDGEYIMLYDRTNWNDKSDYLVIYKVNPDRFNTLKKLTLKELKKDTNKLPRVFKVHVNNFTFYVVGVNPERKYIVIKKHKKPMNFKLVKKARKTK